MGTKVMTKTAPAPKATPKARTTAAPAIPQVGEAWPGEGGVYAGIIRDGSRQWHLILATAPSSLISAEWGNYGESEPSAVSTIDGLANTQALVSSKHSHPAAEQVAALVIDGHNDFYLPAQKENNLLYINLPEHLAAEWHWSSTQYSALIAWLQNFGDGNQYYGLKDVTCAARAVRRLPL
jgi:hypothetical protein